jgi:hypothetical protein
MSTSLILSIKKLVPWYAKLGAKIVLSRIPVSYSVKSRYGIFRHGAMDTSEYAYGVFKKHYERSGLSGMDRNGSGWVMMELGPGDSLSSALVARALGAQKSYLVDVAPFASTDITVLKRMAKHLTGLGLSLEGVEECGTIGEILQLCNAEYLTSGLESLKSIPDHSIDLLFSNAVLEHVRLHEFASICGEMRRIQRPSGVGSHTIDFADHLGDSLNNLRFSQSLWEAEWMVSSGFYTNRIRPAQMCGLFEKAGFQVDVLKSVKWPKVPIKRSRLAAPFSTMDDSELITYGLDVLLR